MLRYLAIPLAALLGASYVYAQAPAPPAPPAPDAAFSQNALSILKQQRDQANDQIVSLGAQLVQAREELQRAQKELADLKAKETAAPPAPVEEKK